MKGLDHHCTWLNVSVGRSNYVPFFVLTVCGAAQFCLQLVVCALMLRPAALVTGGDASAPGFGAWAAALALAALLSLYIASNYGTLLLFHLMLARQGRSTYDWLLDRRKRAKQGAARPVPRPAAAAVTAASSAPVAQQQQQQKEEQEQQQSNLAVAVVTEGT